MITPSLIIADLKSSDGVVISTLSVMPKNFKTGSRGFYANQKLEMGGKRYQVQIQMIEIGSKNPAKENGE